MGCKGEGVEENKGGRMGQESKGLISVSVGSFARGHANLTSSLIRTLSSAGTDKDEKAARSIPRKCPQFVPCHGAAVETSPLVRL